MKRAKSVYFLFKNVKFLKHFSVRHLILKHGVHFWKARCGSGKCLQRSQRIASHLYLHVVCRVISLAHLLPALGTTCQLDNIFQGIVLICWACAPVFTTSGFWIHTSTHCVKKHSEQHTILFFIFLWKRSAFCCGFVGCHYRLKIPLIQILSERNESEY